MFNAPAVSEKIVEDSGQKLFARDWTQENKNWFAAVQVEKKMMTLILFLIIGVAAFNLISMLVMTVNESMQINGGILNVSILGESTRDRGPRRRLYIEGENNESILHFDQGVKVMPRRSSLDKTSQQQ